MSTNVEFLAKEEVNSAYKEIIVQDQEQNKKRAQDLAILPEAAKQQIVEASKYSSYFPNPITKPFMRKYILAKLEFPTKGSELAQSLTELNVRIDNLFTDAYTFEKSKLEAEGLHIELDELDEKIADMHSQIEAAPSKQLDRELSKLLNQRSLKNLEVVNKNHSLKKIELAAMARYNEAMGWKGCVEDILKEMGKASVDEVDFTNIRMDEMAAKIKKWGELYAQDSLEMTPSKFQAIDSNKEAFAAGHMEMAQKLQIEAMAQKRVQELIEQKANSA